MGHELSGLRFARFPRRGHRPCGAGGIQPHRRGSLLHRRGRRGAGNRTPASGARRRFRRTEHAAARPAGRRAARAVGAARRPHDAAARRRADRGHETMGPGTALQRRVGAVGAARGAGAPVRRNGGRLPPRAQGRPGASRRAVAACHGPRAVHQLCAGARGEPARLRRRGSAGAGRQRHRTGRHAPVQAQRLHRLRHRRGARRPTPPSSPAAWTSPPWWAPARPAT